MVLLTMPSASCLTDAAANASHDQESYVALPFYHLDLRGAMVPLIMVFALHDADANAKGTISPRRSCCTSFLSSWPKNIMAPFMMLTVS